MDAKYSPSTGTGALVKAMIEAGIKSDPRPIDVARWWVRGNPHVVSWPKGEAVPDEIWGIIPPHAREKIPRDQWPAQAQPPPEA